MRRPAVLVPMLVVLTISILLVVRYIQHTGRVYRATQVVLPSILELVEDEKHYDAYELALQIKDIIPSDPLLV